MLEIEIPFKDINAKLKQAGKDIPFATALALTWTAKDVQAEHEEMLPRIYDRPTRNTLKGLYTSPATKTKLYSYVGLKDYNVKGNAASAYLRPTIEGGPRGHKGFEKLLIAKGHMKGGEYAIPGEAEPLNRFGNVSQGKIIKALANLRSLRDFHQNSTRGKVYFSGSPFKGAPRGIWVRQGKKIRPFMIFTSKKPRYNKMYDFEGVSNRALKGTILKNVDKALERVLPKSDK